MPEQNYKNHTQFVPIFHFIGYGGILALMIGSIVNLVHSSNDNLYSASLLVLVPVVLLVLALYSRSFALKAQDRAIRAEENLRHFIATGKPFDKRITLRQIIALRFASDAEFVALAKKAADENMSSKEIKMAIQDWRADYYRV